MVIAAIGVLLLVIIGGTDKAALGIPALALVLGVGYFIQQQKLAEATLFKQLFTEFNQRYDRMNDMLVTIAESPDPLDNKMRQKIVDYFNLCAEEYLFFREGYIYPHVWRTWCKGMLWYLNHPTFEKVWAEEQKSEAYYELSTEKMKKGAA